MCSCHLPGSIDRCTVYGQDIYIYWMRVNKNKKNDSFSNSFVVFLINNIVRTQARTATLLSECFLFNGLSNTIRSPPFRRSDWFWRVKKKTTTEKHTHTHTQHFSSACTFVFVYTNDFTVFTLIQPLNVAFMPNVYFVPFVSVSVSIGDISPNHILEIIYRPQMDKKI